MPRLAAIALAVVMALGAHSTMAADPLKVGFVYVGPVGDFGWTYQHNQGRLAVEETFGDRVETTFVESVPEGPDAERVIRQLAASGHSLIFTTSFGYMDSTVKVAQDFSDVMFEHATGYKRAPNVSTYSARFYEGRYVIGKIAGLMTKTNNIGYIASFPIPEVVRGINAVALAAQSVNPDVTITVVWVNSWYDPAKEADAAKALLNQGADILMQHTDSPAAMQVAETEGAFAFGQASNMVAFGPNAQITAIEDNWAPYYVKRVQAALDGTWESADNWGGIAEEEVVMSEYRHLTEDILAVAMQAESDVRSGAVHPFTGPIQDRDGNLRIAEGETASDGLLLGMDWWVDGLIGDLP